MTIGNGALAMVLALIGGGRLMAADVKVTDSKGNVVEVRDVAIDYTEYFPASPGTYSSAPPGTPTGRVSGPTRVYTYTPDHEGLGIRVYQGDALVTINWSKIQAIAIKGKNTSAVPWRYDSEITLTNGKAVSLGLCIDSTEGLHGETELGKYSVQLESLKNIVVLPLPSPGR